MKASTVHDYDYLFKIIITGDSNCGKSKILQRYVYNRFEEKGETTIGVEFIPKNVTLSNGTKVRLQIWDTAGSEKYRAITTGHYRGALGALLVYDISNQESFYNLPYWLECLRENGDPHMVIMLVPNKFDIMFKQPEQREVMKEQGQFYARENNLLFYDECSALADINVNQSMELLIEKVYAVQKELISKGMKASKQLRLRDEDTSLHFNHRCCY